MRYYIGAQIIALIVCLAILLAFSQWWWTP